MNLKQFVISVISAAFVINIAYADAPITEGPAPATAAPNLPLQQQQIKGKGANGEEQSATMDANGQWHAPESTAPETTPTAPNKPSTVSPDGPAPQTKDVINK